MVSRRWAVAAGAVVSAALLVVPGATEANPGPPTETVQGPSDRDEKPRPCKGKGRDDKECASE